MLILYTHFGLIRIYSHFKQVNAFISWPKKEEHFTYERGGSDALRFLK